MPSPAGAPSSTARHIARQFARHFIADDPPPAVVDHFAVFGRPLISRPDLAAIDARQSWAHLAKVKSCQ
jgi:uncharacterized protein (DUF1800 family)